MSRNRSYIIVLVLLTSIAGLSGILSNVASSTLPETWQPYLWLAWPLFVILMLITIGLVIWQARLEQGPTSQTEPGEPPDWVPQLADAIKTAVQPTPSAVSPFTPFPQHSPARDAGFDYDVFISYSSKDRDWVHDELLPHLEAAGLKVCIDLRDFEPGAPSVTEMERAVQTSRKTLLVLTPDYLESAWTEFEALILQTLDPASRKRRLIPLLKAKCDLPPRIRYLTYVDFVEPQDWDIAWTRLLTALSAPPPQPPSLFREDWDRAPYHNLPPRSEFVGREAEKARVHEALRSRSRLVCIDGIGGIGKTALTLEAAYECLHTSQSGHPTDGIATFSGFIWTTAKDRDLTLNNLLDAVAHTLDYPGIVQKLAEEKQIAVRRLLQEKPYLLIVDNFETITDVGVRGFLLNLPEPSKALITTREQKWPEAQIISLKDLTESESLALMRSVGQRLGLASVEQAEDHVLLPLYRATGGAPLAIKWAVGQIKQRGQSLDTVLAALYGAQATIFDRIFARSWELLSADAQRVLTVMPFFATSASWTGIEAASDIHHSYLGEALGQLVEMSLVDVTDELVERRYSIHPLTRAFATAKLQQELKVQMAAQQRLAKFFQSFTEKYGGFWNLERFILLEPDLPNILVIIQWCWEQQHVNLAMDIFHNVTYFMISRGYWNDVMNLGQQAVAKATELGDELSAARFQMWPISWLHRHRGDLDKAEEHVTWALEVFERLGEERDLALVKRNLGRTAQERGELERAEQLLREALAIYQAIKDEGLIYSITSKLASLALERGDLDTAWTLSNDVLAPAHRFGDPEIIAEMLNVLGGVAHQRGDLEQAKAFCEEALVHRERAIRPDTVADALFVLAQIEIEMGQQQIARQKLLNALETYRRLDIRSKAQEVEEFLAGVPEPTTDHVGQKDGSKANEE